MGPLNPIWKFGTIGLGVLCFSLTVYCGLLKFENVGLRDVLAETQLNLVTAQDNEKRLEGTLDDQNAALDALVTEQKKVMIRAAEELAKAQDASRVAQDKAAVLMGGGIDGATLEQRVRAVDAKVLEGLK